MTEYRRMPRHATWGTLARLTQQALAPAPRSYFKTYQSPGTDHAIPHAATPQTPPSVVNRPGRAPIGLIVICQDHVLSLIKIPGPTSETLWPSWRSLIGTPSR